MAKSKKEKAREIIDGSPNTKSKPEIKVAKTAKAKILDRARRYLDEGFEFRYNAIANDLEYKLKYEDDKEYNDKEIEEDDDKEYKEFDDFEFNSLAVDLDLIKGIHLPDYKIRQMITSKHIGEKFDPAKEFIFSLPKWDGETDYIKNFMDQLIIKHEKDREYMLYGFKKWFVAYVMSFIEDKATPYNVNQVALIIMSKKQGLYKSTWLGSILPENLRLQYYYPNSFDPHNKDHLQFLATRMLINLDEMESYNKTDIGVMKSVISTAQVSLRLPYGRTAQNMKRRASFCGSINDRQFLRDETGSRRWFIIEVDAIDFNNDFDVAPMYAQARDLHRNHFKYWFDGIDIAEINERNAQYTKVGLAEEILLRMFDKPKPEEIYDPDVKTLTTTEITFLAAKEHDRLNVNDSIVNNFGKALTKHDFEHVRFYQRNTKMTLWGWRVKPCYVGNIEPEKDEPKKESDDDRPF